MKKIISLVLCLVMCISVFTGTAVQAYALADAQAFFQVTDSGFANEEITYTIKLNPNQTKITGVILNVEFDSEALRVEECRAAGSYNEDGDFVENISGMYATGPVHDNANIYALGYTNISGYNVGSNGAEFFVIKFRALSSDRDWEEVKFNCVEFTTDDGDDTNDINKTSGGVPQKFYSHKFLPLSMPAVTQVNSLETGLRVVWTESIGATSYKIYRRAAAQTEWSELATISGGTTEYIDETAVSGTEYYYTVSASNAVGTTAYDETGVVGFNFGTIAEVNAVAVENGAEITWSALNGADSYEIFRKLYSSNEWSRTPIASIDAGNPTEFIDETLVSGNSYVYRVRAVKGSYYADSAYESAPVKYLAKPEVSVSNVFDGIQISLDEEVGGAEKYIIERKVADGDFEFFAEINADEDLDKVDESTAAGVEYTYSVQAVAEDNYKSATGFSTSITRLGNVTVKSVENKANGVCISWESLPGVNSYSVFYKSESDSQYENISGITATDFTYTDAQSGETYKFFVCAEDETGFGGYEDTYTKTYLATPVMTSVANINEGIRVIWEAVPGAEKYNIYRAEKDSDAWENIADSTETVYIDKIEEEQHGICYKYVVSAVMGNSESAYNGDGLEGMYFGNVSSISATVISNGAVITWNALEKATAYDVYRKNIEGDWIFQAQVTKNTYTDTKMESGVRYYYKVEARNGNSVSEMTATPAEARYIAVPVISVKNAANGIKITITPVGGATGYVVEKNVDGVWKSIKELTSDELTFVDTAVEGDKTYSYRVYAKDSKINSAVSGKVEIVRMGYPKITSISNTIPGVSLKWTPVEDAKEYEIYRKDSTQNEWELIANNVTKPQYTDGLADNGEKYIYTINAITPDGSTGYDNTGKSIKFVETPDMSSATNGQKRINVKWTAVKGATSYKVYRKAGSAKTWTQIGTSKTTTYADTKNLVSGTNYKYSVRAVNSNDSGIGSGISIKYLAVPTLKSVKNVAKGVQVNWNTVKGATSYKVYRKAGSAKTWTQIGTSKTATFTDSKNLTSGTIYKYAVRAVSGVTSDIHSTGLSIRYLAVPKLKTPANVANGIQVKWNAVKGATSYKVYRKLGNAKSWTFVGTSKTTAYTDKGVKNANGKTYKYTVCAVNGSTVGAYNATGLSIKRLSNPALKSAVSSKAGITVKWGAVTGAQGYVVLRKTGKGSFQQIATVKGAKKVSYVDKKAKKGTTYTYTVRAYSGSVKSDYNKGISCKDRY